MAGDIVGKQKTFIDLTGKRFVRLTVLRYVGNDRWRKSRWECKCDCGNITIVTGKDLRRSGSRQIASCGCFNTEQRKKRLTTHGLRDSSEYSTWVNMRARCVEADNAYCKSYGKRGIRVCERWANSFENFIADMGEKPSPEHSIDRIDNNGNYEPGNCRWATPAEQSLNTSRNRFLELDGKKLTIKEWSDLLGINYETIRMRLALGWSTEKTLTHPIRRW